MTSETSADASAKPQALSFGAIVLVRFPFTSQAASKQRPAVIISSRWLGALAVEDRDALRLAIGQVLGR